jgi:hypothetical protein
MTPSTTIRRLGDVGASHLSSLGHALPMAIIMPYASIGVEGFSTA